MCDLQKVLLYLDLIYSVSLFSSLFIKKIDRIIISGNEVIRERFSVASCGLKLSVI